MNKKTQIITGVAAVAACITVLLAMNKPQPQASSQGTTPQSYTVTLEPSEELVMQVVAKAQQLSEQELRSKLADLAPQVQEIAQHAAFMHSVRLYIQENDPKAYKALSDTWSESSTMLFLHSGTLMLQMKNAMKPDSNKGYLDSIYAIVVTMLPLIQEADEKIARGIMIDVLGQASNNLALEAWPEE